MAKRRVWHVMWSKRNSEWVVKNGGKVVVVSTRKPYAVEAAVEEAKDWAEQGGLSQVVVHKQDGEFQFERTYPRSSDPIHRAG